MDRAETIKILSILNIAYPRFEIKGKGNLSLAIELWQWLFKDEPYIVVEIAVQRLILESEYPPTIAAVAKRVSEIKNPRVSTAAEGWEEVMSAVRNHGIYDIENALASMSEFTQKVVETIGFREICMSENTDTVRAQFRMAYEQMETRKRQDDLIPESLKQQMAQIGNMNKQIGGTKDE